jgi:hypothetical protein
MDCHQNYNKIIISFVVQFGRILQDKVTIFRIAWCFRK